MSQHIDQKLNKLKTISCDTEVFFKAQNGFSVNYVRVEVFDLATGNRQTVFNLTKENFKLMLYDLEKID